MNRRISILSVAILALLLAGCFPAHIPSRQPVAGRADLSFIKPGKTSRTEVQARLGPEDTYYEDLGIGCYRQNEVTYREGLFILFIPVASGPSQDRASDVAYIQYDERENVRRLVKARAAARPVSEWRERAEEIAGVQKAK